MNTTIWQILLPAFAECLVLTGLHAYLGLHVLRRKVIFVNLSLAQVAALGTTVGLLFGLSTDSPGAYVLSLSFTLIGAGVFTITRMKRTRVPQEAVIGLIYALAAALAILLVSEGPRGAKQVQSIMTGHLLSGQLEHSGCDRFGLRLAGGDPLAVPQTAVAGVREPQA